MSDSHSIAETDSVGDSIPPQEPKNDDRNPFPPSTVVLAKVKGYPSWPAMVLEESLLPENLIEKRPKGTTKQSKKKNSKPTKILPVRFFSDDTYIWIKDSDIKTLGPDQIDEYLSVDKKKRKDQLLYMAYRLAKNPPEMETFVKYGSKGRKDKVDSELKYEGEAEEDDSIEEDFDEVPDEGEEDYEEPPTKKARKTSSSKKARAKTKNSKSRKTSNIKSMAHTSMNKAQEPKDSRVEGYDSDWGLDELEYDYDSGKYIFDEEEDQQNFIDEFPRSAEIQDSFNKYQSKFEKISRNLISSLLSDNNVDIAEIQKELDGLNSIMHDVPKSIISRSKLLKVLILTVRQPVEKFPYVEVKSVIDKFLVKWYDLNVVTNNMERLQKLDEELNSKDSKMGSQEPSENIVGESATPFEERESSINSTTTMEQPARNNDGEVQDSKTDGSLKIEETSDREEVTTKSTD